MPNFICPNCGDRSVSTDRTAGFQSRARGCKQCGFGFLFELLDVDRMGLDRLDREILRAICAKFGGGPVGLSTLAVAVSEEQDTIEDVYEPYLLQQGLIMRTPRGRVATPAAFSHLGLEPPAEGARLF